MYNIILIFLIFSYSIPVLVPFCHAETNLAKGKAYTVSPQQNYPLSAPTSDKTALTDGKYTFGYFWTQKSTVGWKGVKNIEILIDLENMSTIGSISFSTARGNNGDVHYPSHIAVFAGPDKDKLLYVGDIAKDLDSLSGAYETRQLTLNDIGVKGRYVLLEVDLKGYYLFCDEIEVLEGIHDTGRTGNLTIDAARNLAQQIVRLDIEKNILNILIMKIKQSIDAQPRSVDNIVKIKQNIALLSDIKGAESIETDILRLRGEALLHEFSAKQLLIESISPWGQVSPVISLSGVSPGFLSFIMPQGGYDHVAFLITNLSSDSRQISLSLDKLPAESPELSLSEVPFVKSAAMEYVADPLVPVQGDIILRPGESRMMFLTAQAKNSGTWQSILKVTSSGAVASLPIKSQVLKVALPINFTLNSVNWGYLDFASIRSRKTDAVKDLFAHHTNVIVVPLGHIPLTDPANQFDFSQLETYLTMHRAASKIMLFMDYRTANRRTVGGKYQYLDEKWKEGFLKWYDGIVAAAAKAGFRQEQIYLYPYDEMSEDEIEDFISLSKWAHKEIPGIKFYATLYSNDSEKALPYLDIAQVINNDVILKNFRSTKTELWLYDCKGPAKSLSSYSYYRMMAWKAFLHDYSGIGFWAYADVGWGESPGTAWDEFDGKNPDYAVIYEGEGNTIISSRRWEAWRMGIEDYELLTMYAKAKGDGAAKALAKYVLDNTNDLSRADEVRRKILVELSR